ncbi:hypothetical protein GQ42DRAFT_165986 [Ramicandelaber brevisporus]|nr:hypothetical protein GQ42DRAFT_166011 [Ramicandelaber brevisporus]KAI8865600.1 hypothetical protein GQ42DRAFT_165986 [Ramicandelaber brevisporus]
MIKESIPSSSHSGVDHSTRIENILVAAINQVKNGHYDNANRIKKDLGKIERELGGQHLSARRLIAAKSGLIEAVARAIIMLHRFNELGVAEPMLKKLYVYRRYFTNFSLEQVHKDFCKEWDKKLDGITDAKELEITTAAILYKKQRIYSMIKYASQLCKASKRMPVAAGRIALRDARLGIGAANPPGSTVKLVEEEGKLTLVVKPPAIKPLYFEL